MTNIYEPKYIQYARSILGTTKYYNATDSLPESLEILLKDVAANCRNVNAELQSRQVIALIVYNWLQSQQLVENNDNSHQHQIDMFVEKLKFLEEELMQLKIELNLLNNKFAERFETIENGNAIYHEQIIQKLDKMQPQFTDLQSQLTQLQNPLKEKATTVKNIHILTEDKEQVAAKNVRVPKTKK